MSKILLLPRGLNGENLAGFGRYSLNMINELGRQMDNDKYYTINTIKKYQLSNIENIEMDLPGSNLELSDKILSLKSYLLNVDIVHSFFAPLPQKRTFKSVLTIHDLIYVRRPEWSLSDKFYEFTNVYIRKSAQNSDHIVTVSQKTKYDVMELFGIPEEKITVTYLGCDPIFAKSASNDVMPVLSKYNIDGDFLLSVCTIEPRKNLTNILEAYEEFRNKSNEKIKLVLVGKIGWKYDAIMDKINLSRYKDDIILTGYVPDEDLAVLYKNTLAFLYVSLYEGFGLPVLEAMECGAAVITSNTTSLPEVGGNSVCYCNPESIDDIVSALEKVVLSDSYRDELKSKSIQRAKCFSFEESVRKTKEVYKKILM